MTHVYKNLGILVKDPYVKVIKENMPKKIMLDYTQPGFKDPKKVWSLGVLDTKDLSEDVKGRLRALKSGQEVCIHSMKNSGGFSELVDATDKADAAYKKSSGGGWNKGGGNAGANKFDGDGAQVGNALTNAATLLEKGSSSDALEEMAWEIIEAGDRLKAKLKDKREGKLVESTKKKDSKDPNDLKEAPKEVAVEDDFCDDIPF